MCTDTKECKRTGYYMMKSWVRMSEMYKKLFLPMMSGSLLSSAHLVASAGNPKMTWHLGRYSGQVTFVASAGDSMMGRWHHWWPWAHSLSSTFLSFVCEILKISLKQQHSSYTCYCLKDDLYVVVRNEIHVEGIKETHGWRLSFEFYEWVKYRQHHLSWCWSSVM